MEEGHIKNRKSSLDRVKNCSEKTWDIFSAYSQESTVHSMNYIGKGNLHWIERIFWIAAFLFAFSSCSYLIHQTYEKWETDPMIVSFKERSTPTWQIPFPAITICPESKVDIAKFNFSQILDAIYNNQTLTEEEAERYEALYQVCQINVKNPEETECNILKTLREISSDFAIKSEVKIAGLKIDFLEDFREFVTVNGICYTSNLLNAKDLFKTSIAPSLRFPKNVTRSNWTAYGYDDFNPLAYPQRVIGSGQEAGFQIILKMKKNDIDYTCKSTANSFRLTIHAPNELPQTNSHYYKIPLNVETLIAIEPRVVTTSDELKHYKPKKRQCYFPGEERLTFFKAYTQANCKLECFTDFVLKKCNCVRFSMPHKAGTRLCKRSELACIKHAQAIFVFLELARETKGKSEIGQALVEGLEEMPVMNDTNESNSSDESSYNFDEDENYDELESLEYEFDSYEYVDEVPDSNKDGKTCKCLPACSSIYYAAELSQSSIDVQQHSKINKNFNDDDEDYETAVVSIYFKEDHFIESKRSELYGWTNFLSNCGGFLGLLMGGSFLSLIEIFYHLTFKRIFHSKNEDNDDKGFDEETAESLMNKSQTALKSS